MKSVCGLFIVYSLVIVLKCPNASKTGRQAYTNIIIDHSARESAVTHASALSKAQSGLQAAGVNCTSPNRSIV